MSKWLPLSMLLAAAAAAQPLVTGPVVIVMGPPGSGKSTQAKLIAQTLKLPILSAEAMIEANPKALSNRPGITGIEPRTDPALNALFEAALGSGTYRDGVIVDGYPTTKDHIDHLRSMVMGGRLPNPTILQLEISDEALRKRLGKKADQKFEQLLKDYHREIDMFSVYFPVANIIRVDGTGKSSKVNKRVEDALRPLVPVRTHS
jgi:adenylate kinase